MLLHKTTKGKIIIAAKRLFGSNSYAAISMTAIAADVGITKASLYHFFENKGDLYCAVVEDIISQVAQLCAIQDRTNTYQSFADWIEHIITIGETKGNLIMHMDACRIDVSKEQQLFLHKTFESFFFQMEECMRFYRIPNERLSTQALLTLIRGYIGWKAIDTTAKPPSPHSYSQFIATMMYPSSIANT